MGRPLRDMAMAQDLAECLVLDLWPSNAACVDFGIDTPRHYLALRHAVRAGVSPYQLDRVIGDGPAITRLVSATAGTCGDGVTFCTSYDKFAEWSSWPSYDGSPDPRGDVELVASSAEWSDEID